MPRRGLPDAGALVGLRIGQACQGPLWSLGAGEGAPALPQQKSTRQRGHLPPPPTEGETEVQVEKAACPGSHSQQAAARNQTLVWLSAWRSFPSVAHENKHLLGLLLARGCMCQPPSPPLPPSSSTL